MAKRKKSEPQDDKLSFKASEACRTCGERGLPGERICQKCKDERDRSYPKSMTHRRLIVASTHDAREFARQSPIYRKQIEWHCDAMYAPGIIEWPIVQMLTAIAAYADQHYKRYGDRIWADGVLGPIWLDLLNNWKLLLDGETGRLDCATLDKLRHAMAKLEGIPEDKLR